MTGLYLGMNRGDKGYIRFQRKRTVIITVLMYALSIGIYFLGYFTLHTNKSLWTVIAVLSLLPASKSAVRMIMLLRAHPTDPSLYDEVEKQCPDLFVLYDLIFTTYEKTYVAQALTYGSGNICILSLGGKKGDPKAAGELEAYIQSTLKDSWPSLSVKVYRDKDAFLKRAAGINALRKTHGVSEEEEREPAFFNTLRALTL